MAILVDKNKPSNIGESIFLSKSCAYLDDTNIIYHNRQVFGREFDVCILLPNKGILIVEVKGWREETVSHVKNGDTVIIHTEEGDISASPQKQARGYRFSMERFIKQNIGRFPLVFQMVCLPQISQHFYKSKRLNTVMEENFTFLKEDLESKAAFFAKLDQALREVIQWSRDPFDANTMLQVRNLFEPEICLLNPPGAATTQPVSNKTSDYSRFYFFSTDEELAKNIDDMISSYLDGCKLYAVFSSRTQMNTVVQKLDLALGKKGLSRDYNNLNLSFDSAGKHVPIINNSADSFTAFNCSFSVISRADVSDRLSTIVFNGQCTDEQISILKHIGESSLFNSEQYFVEHADATKNILIQAGAGTGKTHTMISRIGFICYTQNIPLVKMVDKIVMITFTNDAAEQMNREVKAYFRNYYLLTSKAEYLELIGHIDSMQISTIHSYARKLISTLGTEFGYGIDVGITSSEYRRRKKISAEIDAYISEKSTQLGQNFIDQLGMPIYEIQDQVLDFITKLHNKSIDVASITALDFGDVGESVSHQAFHELIATVIPKVEKDYLDELKENNQVHLSTMMSTLHRFISDPKSAERIAELKTDTADQFMFVDEFQDTDDSQIEILLTLSKLLGYRLFVVGDIKQCIYRFRGAEEAAFDKLNIKQEPSKWLVFSLNRNYRTDKHLLNIFDKSFAAWGEGSSPLLKYNNTCFPNDKLTGIKDYNSYLLPATDEFYKYIQIPSDDYRIPALVTELKRIRKRIHSDEQRGFHLSPKEKSIAILVRENWQADLIKKDCKRISDLDIQTSTGGDLYSSQPALDMLILVNALIHFDEADYLYNLVNSNFFDLKMPKSNLYGLRQKIKTSGWRSKVDEKEQTNTLIRYMNIMLSNTDSRDNKWEYIIHGLRTKPVLQALRQIYTTLEPWKNYSEDHIKQRYYQLNVDLLFEQIIEACNIDKLTINTLQQFLYGCIISHTSIDSREPSADEYGEGYDMPIQCITVHKSKGLEYGHVILPFGSSAIDYMKRNQSHVSTEYRDGKLRIGYSIQLGPNKELFQNTYYNESSEKSEKSREETRILYVAMTRAIRSFSWIAVQGNKSKCWQNLIRTEGENNAL